MFLENFTVIIVHPFVTKQVCIKLNKRIIKETGKKKEKQMQSKSIAR